MIRLLLVFVWFVAFCGCQKMRSKMNEQEVNNSIDTSCREDFIYVNGIKLHYLDWGGDGQPLVMVHAWCDSPYLFRDLALALTNKFRVIAYSARGHGQSDVPESGYDIATLTEDLKQLCDALLIDKLNLLGMSSAGNEITSFASLYPHRVHAVIYFEAGYDLAHPLAAEALKNIPGDILPDQDALSSLDSYRRWMHNYWFADVAWNDLLEEHLKASTKITPGGSVQTIPNDAIVTKLLQAHTSYQRDYNKIEKPVLALFAAQFLSTSSHDTTVMNAYNKWNAEKLTPWKEHSISKLKSELKNVVIEEVPGTCHMSIAFKNTPYTVEVISDFLLKK